MRVRFFGFFAGVFISRARPVPGRMAAPAVNAFFCIAWLFVRACIFILLLVSCCRAMFALRYSFCNISLYVRIRSI
jgi:hypothetical protein